MRKVYIFAKKRSIITLKELLNPTYQFSFSIDNEKYLIDIKSRIILDIKLFFPHTTLNMPPTSHEFDLIVHKVTSDGLLRFEDSKKFTSFEELNKYLWEWKEKAD